MKKNYRFIFTILIITFNSCMLLVKEPFSSTNINNSISSAKEICYTFNYSIPVSKSNEKNHSFLILIAYNLYQKDFDKGIYKILQDRLIFDPGLKNEFCKSRIMIQIDQFEVYGSTSNLHQIYNILIYAVSLGIIPIYEKLNFESSFQAKDLLNNKILLKKKYLLKYNMYYNPLYLPFTTLIPYIGNIENDSKENMSEFLDSLDEELTKKYDPRNIPEKTADQ